MISKFLASRWVTIALIVLLAAGGWYIYQQGQKIGELEVAKDELEARQADDERKAEGIVEQNKILRDIRNQSARQERRILEALDEASEEFMRCFNMPVPDGMRIDDGYGDAG